MIEADSNVVSKGLPATTLTSTRDWKRATGSPPCDVRLIGVFDIHLTKDKRTKFPIPANIDILSPGGQNRRNLNLRQPR
jgi:hypothetical protein